MTSIQFPNSSRSYDESRNRICFWGYDKTMEVSFFVGSDAIQSIQKGAGSSKIELLSAFDSALERIHKVAQEVYSKNNRQGRYSCVLSADDF